MPATRIIRFESHHGQEIEIARLPSLGEAVGFAIPTANPTTWLVLNTSPPVWLSAVSLIGETDLAGAVDRFYGLAREVLAAEGVSPAGVDGQLPLTRHGGTPAGA